MSDALGQLIESLESKQLPETILSQAFMGLEFGEMPKCPTDLIEQHVQRCVGRCFRATGHLWAAVCRYVVSLQISNFCAELTVEVIRHRSALRSTAPICYPRSLVDLFETSGVAHETHIEHAYSHFVRMPVIALLSANVRL